MIAPWKLIVIGLVLVILGVVGPLLMVLRLVESTFWLGGISYLSSTVGLIMGMIGSAFYARQQIRDDRWD